MARLKEMYQNEIVDAMIKKFGYKNVMEVPKLDKIVINMGVGEAKDNAKVLDSAVRDLEIITGQKAVLTKAKKSVANFKIREGMAIGCKVTLRGEKMYEFADRLINLALPRVRDFRGVNETHSTAEETTHSVSKSSSSSRRSSMIRLIRLEVWTLFSLQPLKRTKRPVSF